MLNTLRSTCCIVGGGPAGIMLGYLLARKGVEVTVLEKHKDFFRDFRGDTVHPSTLEVMYELGILEDFLRVPHQELHQLVGTVGGFTFKAVDLRHVPMHCKFVALMPQWDFLNFLSEKAKGYPNFALRLEHEVTGLIQSDSRISGVIANTPGGPIEVQADLIVGCDGRNSIVRRAAELPVLEFGVPIDVLWFRIGRSGDDPEQLFGNINYGSVLVLINRGDYFQSGLIIRKGSFEDIKREGLEAFRRNVVRIAPYLASRVHELQDWNQIKLLTVRLNRLRRWYVSGLLCIGDAAHAMSPAGGVGINLAIQDAVATANVLSGALRERRVTESLLARLQCRREFPTRVTQAMQANAHKALEALFRNPGPVKAPWQLKVAVKIPGISHVLARAVGVGVRPEHIAGARRSRAYRNDRMAKFAIALGVAGGFLSVLVMRRKPAS
ncbi:MAG TPA: FAD-dependent oxidoreductase [Terriglobales bacterium]|nr:FAD-dependent oxidoreductase [Terriglobales bacterium]